MFAVEASDLEGAGNNGLGIQVEIIDGNEYIHITGVRRKKVTNLVRVESVDNHS